MNHSWASSPEENAAEPAVAVQNPDELYARAAAEFDLQLTRRMGLAAPGVILATLGQSLGPRPIPWSLSIGLIGIAAFVYLGTVIYGKILAARWQREIDSLNRMCND
jgi:hypothetical protein